VAFDYNFLFRKSFFRIERLEMSGRKRLIEFSDRIAIINGDILSPLWQNSLLGIDFKASDTDYYKVQE
jgi:hypothetical protein